MKKALLIILIFSSCEFRMDDEEARKSLKVSPVEIQFGDVMVEDRNIHYAYTDQGKGIMAVFVHGSPGSWNAFINFFKADTLSEKLDLLALDRAGFGNSGFGFAERSLKVQAYQIKKVLDQFPDKQKILIGHSLGGPVVARMAMDYPSDFLGTIMVAPSIDPELEEDEWYRKVINSKIGSFFTPKEFVVSNDEIMSLKSELEAMVPLWEQIKIPTIVIQGTEDSLVPKENAAFAQEMLPDSLLSVIMLEGANHFIPWSHPGVITKAIYLLTDDQ